jgi:hypothetical protein
LKTISLARFELDGPHVTGLGFALDDARLATGLRRTGIVSQLYSGRRDGRIVDLVRPLARMRTDAYGFWVSSETAAVTRQIVAGLARLNQTLRFVFWGLTSDQNFLMKELSDVGEVLPSNSPEETLRLLIADSVESQNQIDEADFSPYLSETVSPDHVSCLGLRIGHDLSCFEKEIDWLSRQTIQSETPIPLHASLASGEVLIDALGMLVTIGKAHKFELRANADACTDPVIDCLGAVGISRIIITGDIGRQFSKLKTSGIEISTEGDIASRSRAYGLGGSIAFHAGAYFDAPVSPGIYHLGVPLELSAEQRRKVYCWISDSMAIRSAVILNGPYDLVIEHLPELEAPLNLETRGWPKHSYAVAMSDGGSRAKTIFDGKEGDHGTLHYVPLSKLAEVSTRADATIIVTMHEAEDADELERRLERFHSTGALSATHPDRPVYFENMCRWTGYGGCKLPLLRRVEVGPDLRLRACRDAGDLGSVGDAFETLVKAVKHHQQMEEVRRGCATCVVRDECSHCAYLPAAWGGRYCQIRQTYPHTNLYFELGLFPHLVGPSLPAASNDIEMKVSGAGLPLQHYLGAVGRESLLVRPAHRMVARDT